MFLSGRGQQQGKAEGGMKRMNGALSLPPSPHLKLLLSETGLLGTNFCLKGFLRCPNLEILRKRQINKCMEICYSVSNMLGK